MQRRLWTPWQNCEVPGCRQPGASDGKRLTKGRHYGIERVQGNVEHLIDDRMLVGIQRGNDRQDALAEL